MIKSHDVGTIRYIEWLILNDRVQPSFIAGGRVRAMSGWSVDIQAPLPVRCTPYTYGVFYRVGAATHGRPSRCIRRCVSSATHSERASSAHLPSPLDTPCTYVHSGQLPGEGICTVCSVQEVCGQWAASSEGRPHIKHGPCCWRTAARDRVREVPTADTPSL